MTTRNVGQVNGELNITNEVPPIVIKRILTYLDSVGDYRPYKDLYQCDQPEFGMFTLTDVVDKSSPHTKGVSYNNLEGDTDVFLRGELLIILRMIIGQFRKRRYIPHMVIPVRIPFPFNFCKLLIETPGPASLTLGETWAPNRVLL